ncbi:hypothetical protein M427DRAFT_147439 [Gonapodya prolifera JEL478]|uniref:ER-bound oxygenase mpaB/mpaB'/Rubber oxygenase catalytic domain-containing protein n=1 Tax=Gonapodya prolifera (strain JEL478) TaxID=1344416 RepID=A0A139A5B4_GONPJ|nr:hypothetical protein M427DRAFT_147439 [Gonapodya prolifera JEL478]|eukprot:KXS11921.1 hypothetical protein M427DRAFT_147439 [Gonapodya prolifera JEL478]
MSPAPPFHPTDIGLYWLGSDKGILARFPPVPTSKLAPLRFLSDEPVDAYINESGITIRDDAAALLKEHSSAGMKTAVSLSTHLSTKPSWVDLERIKRGQQFYWRNSEVLSTIQLTALVVGTTFRKAQKVLTSTGYLTSERSAFKRLLETSVWVSSLMSDNALEPEHEGWSATLRVRFLHAQIRARIRKVATKKPEFYDEAFYGVPVNQEDMAVTLLEFASGPLVRMAEMGFLVSSQERDDYLHLWRFIGYLSGVREEINPLAHGLEPAASFAYSYCLHNCQMTTGGDNPQDMTQALLRGFAQGVAGLQSPSSTTSVVEAPTSVEKGDPFGYLVVSQIVRTIIGPRCSALLGVKQPGLVARLVARLTVGWWWLSAILARYIPWFGVWLMAMNKRTVITMQERGGVVKHKFLMSHVPK